VAGGPRTPAPDGHVACSWLSSLPPPRSSSRSGRTRSRASSCGAAVIAPSPRSVAPRNRQHARPNAGSKSAVRTPSTLYFHCFAICRSGKIAKQPRGRRQAAATACRPQKRAQESRQSKLGGRSKPQTHSIRTAFRRHRVHSPPSKPRCRRRRGEKTSRRLRQGRPIAFSGRLAAVRPKWSGPTPEPLRGLATLRKTCAKCQRRPLTYKAGDRRDELTPELCPAFYQPKTLGKTPRAP